MRQAFVAALALVAAGHEPAFADFHASIESLSGWIDDARVPPLATSGGNAIIGAPGTRVVLGDLAFAARPQGARVTLGYRLEGKPLAALEASYFFLSNRRSEATFASSGDPLLGRPFIDALTNAPDVTRVAAPGVASGSLAVGSKASLCGAEANLATLLASAESWRLAALAGLRFLRLEDELGFVERFHVSPEVQGFGGSAVDLRDQFHTDNRFFGAQAGLRAMLRHERLTLDLRGTIGAGRTRQTASIDGLTSVLTPGGGTTVYQGGLLALRTNIGRHARTITAFVPEARASLRYDIARRWQAFAAYSILGLDRVARAGEQVDPVVNTTQFPILSGNGPLAGPARPRFGFVARRLWMQTLGVGVAMSF